MEVDDTQRYAVNLLFFQCDVDVEKEDSVEPAPSDSSIDVMTTSAFTPLDKKEGE